MESQILHTNHLELIAATSEHIKAELESPECLASLLNTQVEQGWPPGEYDRNAQEFFFDILCRNNTSAVGWYIWYAISKPIHNKPSLLIGAGGYFGPPKEDGIVEIGFSIMTFHRNMGYATEIAEALVENAFNNKNVHKVIAHTTNNNTASCKVLEKSGFHYVSEDYESGIVLFERQKDNH